MLNEPNDPSSSADLFEVSGNSPPTALNSAKDYARRGWRVFPIYEMRGGECTCGNPACSSPGKHPRTSAGFKDATISTEQIDSWWHQWPNANVAIRTGGGIVVIDVDPRNGGDKALQKLQDAHGALPVTITANTGGGGKHYFFTDPGVLLKSKLDTGIDVKREGGYVVAAPSNHHTGGVYSWEPGSAPGEVELAPLPDWVIKILTAAPAPPSSGAPGDIPDGQRNSTLTSMAGSMRRAGFDEGDIYTRPFRG